MLNSKIYIFNWSNISKFKKFRNIITYTPIIYGLIVLLSISIVIIILNKFFPYVLTYSLALAAPLITVTLIHLKESFSKLNHEKRLKSALIDEILFNLQSIKSNDFILDIEAKSLEEDKISTDPLVKMVGDVWEMIRFYYASKAPDFDMDIIYTYIRGLYVINEAIEERKLYTVIHISSRKEYNKVIGKISSDSIVEIEACFETLNARMFSFKDNVTIDEVATTLNQSRIPMPTGILPLFENKLDELVVIVNQN